MEDFVLYYRVTGMNVFERQLQLCINGVDQWSVLNGFKFSKVKTVCIHFCQLHRMHAEPELTLDADPIKDNHIFGPHFRHRSRVFTCMYVQ